MNDLTSDLLARPDPGDPDGDGHGAALAAPPPNKRRAGVRMVGLVSGILVLVLLGGLGVKAVLDRVLEDPPPDYPGPGNEPAVVIEVQEGQLLSEVGETLLAADVVESVEAFNEAARDNPDSSKVQVGFFSMLTQMKAADALDRLLDPQYRVETGVTFPEGLTVHQTYDTASKATGIPVAAFEEVERTQAGTLGLPSWDTAPADNRLEGFLFPATYPTNPGTTAQGLMTDMVAKFNAIAEKIDFEAEAPKNGVTPYEALIVASIAQEEAGIPGDIGKVARVIYNRLAAGMPLQMDSTVNYALGKSDITLSDSDVQIDSPYNTYKYPGLPPTPIANPGETAMEAAVNPPEGDWLYFVLVDKDGTSFFTSDYDEFLEAKQKAKDEGVF